MGSFPSHSPSSHQQQGYIQPVNSRTPGFLNSEGSKGKIKNTPMIEKTPYDNQQESKTNNLRTPHHEAGNLGTSLKPTSLETVKSKSSSRSANDILSHPSPAVCEDNQEDETSSLLPEHSFQMFHGFALGTNSRYSPHISSLPLLPLLHLGSLPISFKPTEIEFSKKNKRSFSLDERSDEQTIQERHLHSSVGKRKMSTIPVSGNNNLLPPDLSITISTPEESTNTKKNTLQIPTPSNATEATDKIDDTPAFNLSEFKMGTRTSPKKAQVDDVPNFKNFQLGQKPAKQKKVGFMGPLVDILVHGGLGLPNNHKIRRHSYTPQPTTEFLEKPKVSQTGKKQNSNLPQPTLSPTPSEKRDLRKSAVDFVLPTPVDIEPSPKLFVATISKTRRMSLKDETAERLNELLSKQRTDQFKL